MFYGSNYLVTPEPYLILTSLQASAVPAVTLEGQRHSPSPYYLLQPHKHFPHQGRCCGRTGPCSYCDCRMHFGKNNQGTLKSKIYYSQALESTWHAQGLHSEVEVWVMGEAEREQTWALTLLGSEHGCLRLHEVTHYWPIWSTRVGIRAQETGGQVIEVVCYLSHPGFSERGTSWAWKPCFLSGCFASNCRTAGSSLFEMDVFWNGCLGN